MAVTVNGEDILLADYQSEINRLQQALTESGQTMTADEQKETVLAMLIDSSLLARKQCVQDLYWTKLKYNPGWMTWQ